MSVFDEGCNHGVVGFCTACDDALRIRRLKASLAAAKKERDEVIQERDDARSACRFNAESTVDVMRYLDEARADLARVQARLVKAEAERDEARAAEDASQARFDEDLDEAVKGVVEQRDAAEKERDEWEQRAHDWRRNLDIERNANTLWEDRATAIEKERDAAISRAEAAEKAEQKVFDASILGLSGELARVQAQLAKVEEVAQDARDVCLGLVNLDDLEAALGSSPPDTYIYTPPHASEHAGEVVTVRGRGKFKTARMAALGWVETVEYLSADGGRCSRPVAEFESLFVKQTKEGT